MLRRPAFTLAELLVAMSLAGIVLAAATASLLRQQRSHARVLSVTDGDAQTRAAMLVVASQLALLDPRAGDLAPGEAADSAIQFRALIASSIACSTEPAAVTLVPDVDTIPLGGALADARPGDTLWWLADSAWRSAEVSAAGTVGAACVAPVAAAGPTQRILLGAADTIAAGTPVRITRQARLGIYRASDGTWQLGYREWNAPAHRFAAPQPVVGPLRSHLSALPSGFRYFDSTGTQLQAGALPIDVREIARIRLTARVGVQGAATGQDSLRADSVDVALRRGNP